jgi:hypothetical protein
MMRAAAPFSFFLLLQKTTNKKKRKKQPKTSSPKSPNFKAPPNPQLRVQETKTLMGKYKTGW